MPMQAFYQCLFELMEQNIMVKKMLIVVSIAFILALTTAVFLHKQKISDSKADISIVNVGTPTGSVSFPADKGRETSVSGLSGAIPIDNAIPAAAADKDRAPRKEQADAGLPRRSPDADWYRQRLLNSLDLEQQGMLNKVDNSRPPRPGSLMERYLPKMTPVAKQLEAFDALTYEEQDVFIAALKKAGEGFSRVGMVDGDTPLTSLGDMNYERYTTEITEKRGDVTSSLTIQSLNIEPSVPGYTMDEVRDIVRRGFGKE